MLVVVSVAAIAAKGLRQSNFTGKTEKEFLRVNVLTYSDFSGAIDTIVIVMRSPEGSRPVKSAAIQ